MVLVFHQKNQNKTKQKNKQTKEEQSNKKEQESGGKWDARVGYMKPPEAVTVEEALPYMFETVNDPALLGI